MEQKMDKLWKNFKNWPTENLSKKLMHIFQGKIFVSFAAFHIGSIFGCGSLDMWLTFQAMTESLMNSNFYRMLWVLSEENRGR